MWLRIDRSYAREKITSEITIEVAVIITETYQYGVSVTKIEIPKNVNTHAATKIATPLCDTATPNDYGERLVCRWYRLTSSGETDRLNIVSVSLLIFSSHCIVSL